MMLLLLLLDDVSLCLKGNFKEVVNHIPRKRNKIQILILIITDNDCVWIVLGAASVPNGKKPRNVCQYCEFDIATLPQYRYGGKLI